MAIDRLVPGGLIKRTDDSFFGSIERHFIYMICTVRWIGPGNRFTGGNTRE